MMGVFIFEKDAEQKSEDSTKDNSEHDGDWNTGKVPQVCAAALCHADEGRKQDNYIDVVTGSTGKNHLQFR